MREQPKKFSSSIEWLLDQIEQFLKANASAGLTAEGFGWKAIGDPSLVKRLRQGGDVTTRKMDKIIRYLENPNQTEK